MASTMTLAQSTCSSFTRRSSPNKGSNLVARETLLRPFTVVPSFRKGRSVFTVTHARRGLGPTQSQQKTDKRASQDRAMPEALEEAAGGSPLSWLALSLPYAGAAGVCAFAPTAASSFLFGAPYVSGGLEEPLFRILACGLLTASVVSYTLKVQSERGELSDRVSQRLELGLITFATVNALLQTTTAAAVDSVLTFPGFWATALIFGITIFVGWGGYGKNSEYGLSLKRFGPTPIGKFIQDDTASYTEQSNLSSLIYSGLTVALFLAGVGYLFSPEATLDGAFGVTGGPEAEFLWRAIGASLITIVPVATFSLREGSERGELSETPYRLLNFGLAGAGLGHVLAFLPFLAGDGGGALTGIVAATWAVAAGIGGANFLGLLSNDE